MKFAFCPNRDSRLWIHEPDSQNEAQFYPGTNTLVSINTDKNGTNLSHNKFKNCFPQTIIRGKSCFCFFTLYLTHQAEKVLLSNAALFIVQKLLLMYVHVFGSIHHIQGADISTNMNHNSFYNSVQFVLLLYWWSLKQQLHLDDQHFHPNISQQDFSR